MTSGVYIRTKQHILNRVASRKKYDKNGMLSFKDIQRQKEIQEMFPDFKFKRIKESDTGVNL